MMIKNTSALLEHVYIKNFFVVAVTADIAAVDKRYGGAM